MESKDFIHGEVNWFKNPIPVEDSFEEGNMANIFPSIKINITNKLGVKEIIILGEQCTLKEIDYYTKLFKEFHNVFTSSYYKMPRLDPTIVVHHIDTWSDAIPSHQMKRNIHPSKCEAIKDKIDKLKKARFIYPIEYIAQVSNPIPVLKKEVTICVYIDFHDLNKGCPKDNFPTPFINQDIDEYVGYEVLPFWMDSSDTTRYISDISIN